MIGLRLWHRVTVEFSINFKWLEKAQGPVSFHLVTRKNILPWINSIGLVGDKNVDAFYYILYVLLVGGNSYIYICRTLSKI